jgi:hypothetical protein
MIISAPNTVRNNFHDELSVLADENKFESVKRYYQSFMGGGSAFSSINNPESIGRIKEDPNNLILELEEARRYKNIDPRINDSKFFYFPTESKTSYMNCLEKSACMYFALEELYPRSNPALTYVMFDNGNIHATTLFTHKNKLHAADPNFSIFGEIHLTDKEIIVKGKSDGENRIYEYADIFKVNDNVLNQMALKLRSDRGIVDFVLDSGQVTGRAGFESMTHLFTYVEGNKVVSEMREPHKGIRFSNDERFGVSLLEYEKYWWRGITGEKRIPIPRLSPFKTCTPNERITDYYPIEGMAHFIKHIKADQFSIQQKQKFLNDPKIMKRFEASFEDAKGYSEETRERFVDFLMHKFGEDPAQILPLKESSLITLLREDGKEVSADMPIFNFEGMSLRNVLEQIQMANDAKRYSAEIKKHMD